MGVLTIGMSLLLALCWGNPTNTKEQRRNIQKRNLKEAQNYLKRRSPQVRNLIINQLNALKQSPFPFHKLFLTRTGNPEKIIVFIQGISLDKGHEWYQPFSLLIGKPVHAYFYKIFAPANWQVERVYLKHYLGLISKWYPQKKIQVMAYSAGGALMLDLWKDIWDLPKFDNFEINTISSPISGYNPHQLAGPFIDFAYGTFVRKVAYGLAEDLEGLDLPRCQHHITTNCQRDYHACKASPHFKSPQLLNQMPCSNQVIKKYTNASHSSVLGLALINSIRD